MSVVAVFNQKGGVGKTTTTFNLAAGLARDERPPIAIDLDPQGHLTLACGFRNVPGPESVFAFFQQGLPLPALVREAPRGVQLVPAALDLSKVDALYGADVSMTRRLRGGFEQAGWLTGPNVLIDCCPMLGVLTLNALMAADHILIPVAADYLSLQGVHRINAALDVLERKGTRKFQRRVVVTRYDARRKLSFRIFRELQTSFPGIVCETRVHETVSLAESPMHGKDIFAFAPSSQGAADYRQLLQELDADGFLAA
ncbi:MAG: AAA family ATPase [Betaproteobacteria bacterium]|nr:AAA family ATPase [Betaproteobacteria bacterium]